MFNCVFLKTIQGRNENKTHFLNSCIMFNTQDTFRGESVKGYKDFFATVYHCNFKILVLNF